MTDNDIIKAFGNVVKSKNNKIPVTGKMLLEDTLDLINRQQAEIERYKGVIKLLESDVQTAKAEAVKEFERKIKAHAYYIDVPKEHRVVDEDDIDAVLKEMTEQSVNYGSSKTEGNG